MTDAKFELYKGKVIMHLDLQNSKNVEENVGVFDKAKEQIIKQPAKTVLLLTDVTNAFYDSHAAEKLKQFSKDVTPYVKASAAVGVTGIKKIIAQAMMTVSGRKIQLCDTVEQAKEWLINQ